MSRIASIQSLRGIAALSVVIFHEFDDLKTYAAVDIDAVTHRLHVLGTIGVDLFFCVSGFVMVVVLARSPARQTPWRFIVRRIVRIVPAYWLLTLLVFGLHAATASRAPQAMAPGWRFLLASLLFIPAANPQGLVYPVLSPGWTLSYEVFFYALLALFVGLPVRVIAALVGSILLGLVTIGWLSHPAGPSLVLVTDPLLLEFLLGMAIGLVFCRAGMARPATRVICLGLSLGILALAVLALTHAAFIHGDTERLLLRGLPAALLVGAFVCLEQTTWLVSWPPLLVLGEMSYSLYLTHDPGLAGFNRIAVGHLGLPPVPAAGLAVATSLAVAWAFYVLFERPVTRWLMGRLAVADGAPADADSAGAAAADRTPPITAPPFTAPPRTARPRTARPGTARPAARAAAGSATLVIPTLNPGGMAQDLVAALQAQVPKLERVIIIESDSNDGSGRLFRAAGFEVAAISQAAFDHGGTRNLGVALARPAEIVVFLTQDAVLTNSDAVARLLVPFADARVGLAYGRQLPRAQAGPIESHGRLFNYPAIPAARTMPEAASLGIKAIFNSNAFAAYRVAALDAIGGFPQQIIMGEDQVAAGRLLLAGWKVVYQADATVRHSHGYSVLEEFRRYFDIGVFHEHERDLLANFGRAEAEGGRFVRSEIGYLLDRASRRIPEALLRDAMKLTGYRLGRRNRRLPVAVVGRLTMNPAFFRADPPEAASQIADPEEAMTGPTAAA